MNAKRILLNTIKTIRDVCEHVSINLARICLSQNSIACSVSLKRHVICENRFQKSAGLVFHFLSISRSKEDKYSGYSRQNTLCRYLLWISRYSITLDKTLKN